MRSEALTRLLASLNRNAEPFDFLRAAIDDTEIAARLRSLGVDVDAVRAALPRSRSRWRILFPPTTLTRVLDDAEAEAESHHPIDVLDVIVVYQESFAASTTSARCPPTGPRRRSSRSPAFR